MELRHNPDGTLEERSANMMALKLIIAANFGPYMPHLSTADVAEVCASMAGDLAASSSGSSAIQLGKLLAQMKAVMDEQGLLAFTAMAEHGIN